MPAWMPAVLERWQLCRDGQGGFRHLPAAGGVGDQPAWLMDALDILEAGYLAARPKS